MSLRLIIEDDEGSTTIVPLGTDAITIGRQQGNTIQLTEKNVSRRHAQLLPEGESWIIEDLGSYNGVKVNGRVTSGRVVLQEGDVVQIGDYHLALTEDVDRRSLNYDRARPAANEGHEPMLASSSTNLPKLSPEELAALSSGQHPAHVAVVAPPAFIDSGQMPMASRPPPAYADDQPRRTGMLVGLGLVLIGGLALGGFWWASQNASTTSTANAAAKAETGKGETKPAKAVVEAKTPTPTPPPPDTNVQPPVPPDTKVEPPVPEPVPDTPPDVVVDEPPEPTPKPPKPTPEKPQPKKPPPPTPTPKPTPAPEAPEVDVAQLLADARKQSMTGNPSAAYDLANKAYAASKSQDALNVMATSACKMGDAGKAKKAIAKLKGQKKDDAIALCASKGITI